MDNEPSSRAYWEERLSRSDDLSSVGYTVLGKEYNQYLYKLRRRVFLDVVSSYLPDLKEADVLDIGSGTGFYIDLWELLGARTVVGSDLSSVAVERLLKKFPGREIYQVDIGSDLGDLGGRSFDYVSAFDVLFHLTDDEQYLTAIENIYTLLKINGLFILSENFLHGERINGPRQANRTLATINSHMNRVGFTIIDRFPMFYMMNTPIDSQSVLLKSMWRLMTWAISRHEFVGKSIGRILYPLEYFLIRHKRESPSTEIMICSKQVR